VTYRVPAASNAVVASMVRGLYGVKVDAAVVGSRTSVLVSRDDAVDLRVVTLLDAAVIAVTALLLLGSLIFGGVLLARRRGRAARQQEA
jgi:hypothetical protein